MAGTLDDPLTLTARTTWKEVTEPAYECLDILRIDALRSLGSTLASEDQNLSIGQALLLCADERCLVHQHALTFIPLAGSTEAYDDRTLRRVFARATGEHRVATREEDEVVEIGTAQAQWPVLLHPEKLPLEQLRPAFLAR